MRHLRQCCNQNFHVATIAQKSLLLKPFKYLSHLIRNNIPIIFYFNGTHDDYHRHTDTPDKINYDLLENRSRLVFHTAWELANRAERIVVDKATEE